MHEKHIIHRDLKPENIFLAVPSGKASEVRAPAICLCVDDDDDGDCDCDCDDDDEGDGADDDAAACAAWCWCRWWSAQPVVVC